MDEPLPTLIGKRLSHFLILERIGSGGMGVVYRAQDERLRRDVAIKVLPPLVLGDESARHRFRREALTLSRLNHPNIETVLGFETDGGIDFLIMEYVAGKSLEERIRAGSMPEEDVVAFGIAIADALVAAHSHGVIHCDLKPANVGLTPDGRVKVLDFGLARVLRPAREDSTTSTLQDVGSVAGTLAYMAPEQVLGKPLDHRVDLYGLGVLLYRLATGRTPFIQDQTTALIHDILHRLPQSPRTFNPNLSMRLDSIITRCLEKDAANRYQTAADLRADLGRLKRDTEFAALGVSGPSDLTVRRSHRTAWIIGLALPLCVLAAWWILVLRRTPGPAPSSPHRQVTFTGTASNPAISHDGEYAAYIDRSVTGKDQLLVQDLAGGEALVVFSARACIRPLWSPDGSEILCQAFRDSGEAAFLVPKLGGTPRRLPALGYLHSWSPDGRKFASTSPTLRRLLITDIGTGDTSSIALESVPPHIVDIDWSPQGDRIALLAADEQDAYSFWTVGAGSGRVQKWFDVRSEASSPRWAGDGKSLFFLRRSEEGDLRDLCVVRWTNRSGRSDFRTDVLIAGLPAGEYFTQSSDGRRLLYTREAARSNLWWIDLAGSRAAALAPKQLTTGTFQDANPALSPDGLWLAFARNAGRKGEIHRVSLRGGDTEQLTFMESQCRLPVWSPGGDTIAFLSNQGGASRLWRVPAQGGPARSCAGLELSGSPLAPIAWAPAASILCERSGRREYVLLSRTGKVAPIGSRDSMGVVIYPQFSWDGERIAWWTARPRGLWIMNLVDRRRTRVLADGPVLPLAWTPDGRWIYAADARGPKLRLTRVSTDGRQRETGVDLPLAGVDSDITSSRDGRCVVFSVISQQEDVWLAEGFTRRIK
ncbi:MAG TPA: protein kinase [Candidatus Binatia bacterium]|nr:protein kinase [Candidatus Binatia bacterium]